VSAHLYSRSLILLRGLPGSGKSTLAAILSSSGKFPVHSVDHYFTDSVTRVYEFDYTKNHLAYRQCEERTRTSMAEKCEIIFIDNTFTMDWEMKPYFEMAAEYEYSVFVITVENYHGKSNIHYISRDQLEKMAEKYKVKLF
jgi:predicted kinase